MTQLPNQNNDLVSIAQAAEILGYSTKTLRRWEKKGLITAKRTFGGHRRYDLASVAEIKNKIEAKALKRHIELPFYIPKHEVRVPSQIPVRVIFESPKQSFGPVLYSKLHLDQVRVFRSFAVLVLIALSIFGLSKTVFSSLLTNQARLSSLGSGVNGQVLQATTSVPFFNVAIESNFKENSLFEKDVEVAGDLTLGGDLVVATALNVPSLVTTGTITSGGKLTAGGDLDITGTTTLGTLTAGTTTLGTLTAGTTTLGTLTAGTTTLGTLTAGTTTLGTLTAGTTTLGTLTAGTTTLGTTTTGALTASSGTFSGALSIAGHMTKINRVTYSW
ncbi:MAG: helix-turn-helix domain-containing protein, partial [Patescibacteria group bacterium]